MSALSIQPTYPIFTDIDGQPLENGFVWVGTTNLDPQSNPISVYWDKDLTIPAAQPIRTLAGYPSNGGTPARLYVAADYSIRVTNKNGSVVYSAPAATERVSGVVVSDIDASLVGYTPAGGGAVATTLENQLKESVSLTPTNFNAPLDGSTSATPFLQNAIDALPDGGTLDLLGKTFRVTKGASHAAYPNNDQPCLVVHGKKNVTIRNGTLVVLEHGQSALDIHTSTRVTVEMLECVGAGNFPPLDGSTGRGEKGVSGAGYYDLALANAAAKRNNSVDTSAYTGGGYGGAFPRLGGGTGSTWGTWNGGYLVNFGYGISVISSTDCVIKRNEARLFNGSGVYVGIGSSSTVVEHNYAHHNYTAGIEYFSTSSGESLACMTNRCHDNGHPDASIAHVDIDPGYGITTNNGTTPPKDLLITGNFCYRNKRKGIDSHASDRLTVTNNFIKDSGHGIQLSGSLAGVKMTTIICQGNQIRRICYGTSTAAKMFGLLVSGNATTMGETMSVVNGNIIEEVGPLLASARSSGFNGNGLATINLQSNAVHGNIVRNSTAIGDVGLASTYTSGAPVLNQTITGNCVVGKYQIGIIAGAGSAGNEAAVSGNTLILSDIATEIPATQQLGLTLAATANVATSGNRVTLGTANKSLSSHPLGSSVQFTVTLPTLAVTSIRQSRDSLNGVSVAVASAFYGLLITLDARYPTPISASITMLSSTVVKTSDSTIVTRAVQREVALGSVQIGLQADDLGTKTSAQIAGSAATGILSVTVNF